MNWEELNKILEVQTKHNLTTTVDDIGDVKTVYFRYVDSTKVAFWIDTNNMFGIENLGNVAAVPCQLEIMNFLMQDSEEWFKEREYNIVLGKNMDDEQVKTAYAHFGQYFYVVNDVCDYDLSQKGFVFTESKLKELESKLPDRLAKIVDLAKVEVNGNDY